jgi:hypothetical protein
MNLDGARAVADAVLYEGYLLYPYRASAQKNRSRWQFGVLMPPGYAMREPSESSTAQAECVLECGDRAVVQILVRFLQVQRRTDPDGSTWDEAVAQEVPVGGRPSTVDFEIDGGRDGTRVREPLRGKVSVRMTPVRGPWNAMRIRVRVENETQADPETREAALPHALVAMHLLLAVEDGAFVSMVDPPEWAREAVDVCNSKGLWPVLAGPPDRRDVMLAAPIILYDHVRIAPESPGELFDGTEIDEILTLRTLALTDGEKAAARATDPRAADLLDRV